MADQFIEEALNPALKVLRLERERDEMKLRSLKNNVVHSLDGSARLSPEPKRELVRWLREIATEIEKEM